MARPGVTFHGLDSFEAELRVLTRNLVDEANEILIEAAFDAKGDVAAAYPFVSGDLQAGLQVRPAQGILLAGAELVNVAWNASMYERGTQVRATKAGYNRGAVPPHPTLEPIAAAHRRTAINAINARLYHYGATQVTGDADAA